MLIRRSGAGVAELHPSGSEIEEDEAVSVWIEDGRGVGRSVVVSQELELLSRSRQDDEREATLRRVDREHAGLEVFKVVGQQVLADVRGLLHEGVRGVAEGEEMLGEPGLEPPDPNLLGSRQNVVSGPTLVGVEPGLVGPGRRSSHAQGRCRRSRGQPLSAADPREKSVVASALHESVSHNSEFPIEHRSALRTTSFG